MRREGRQHGTVITHCNLPPTTLTADVHHPRKVNPVIGAPPTAGIFIRVSSKPTNHSKFTGKCRRPGCSTCHLHPSSKSKEKTKGSSKLKSLSSEMDCGNALDELYDYADIENHGDEEDVEEVELDENGCDLDEKPRLSNWLTGKQNRIKDENEDNDLGFYDVAYALEPLDCEEGWSLVGQI